MSRLFINYVTISCSKNILSSSMKKSREPMTTVSFLRNCSSNKSDKQNLKIKLLPFKPEKIKSKKKDDSSQNQPKNDDSLNYIQITNKLRQDPTETYLNIFGPGVKATTKDQIRWPDGLVVDIREESTKRGLWYDFKNNVGGGPIQAIMYSRYVTLID